MHAQLNVIFVGSVKLKENNQGFMYFINDGIYGAFNFILFDHEPLNPVLLKVRFCIKSDKVRGQDGEN